MGPPPQKANEGDRSERPDAGGVPFTCAHTTKGVFTDSGYASALASVCQKSALGGQGDSSKLTTLAAPEELDARTIYSDEGSIHGAELDTYKVELVDNLVNRVRQFEPGPDSLESVFEAMPSLMRAFALELGRPGSTKVQRDVMYFVHKYRQ